MAAGETLCPFSKNMLERLGWATSVASYVVLLAVGEDCRAVGELLVAGAAGWRGSFLELIWGYWPEVPSFGFPFARGYLP